jgi:hypothetical protein
LFFLPYQESGGDMNLFKIYIPSTYDVNRKASRRLLRQVTNDAKTEFSRLCGGFTEYPGNGGYVSAAGKLIEERVRIVEAYTEKDTTAEILALAARIRKVMKQESVLVVKNAETFFVST